MLKRLFAVAAPLILLVSGCGNEPVKTAPSTDAPVGEPAKPAANAKGLNTAPPAQARTKLLE